nr:hypothetical protein BaRGS_035239 [Batillaria attramentaria]
MRTVSSRPGRTTETQECLDAPAASLYWELEEDPYTMGELAEEDGDAVMSVNTLYRGQEATDGDYGYTYITTPGQGKKPDYNTRPPVPIPRQVPPSL